MAALTSRVYLKGNEEPEDFFSESLGVIFPDDVMVQHGDADHAITYTSPHLPKSLEFELSDPTVEKDRLLFSHHLWNASLLAAEFVEADTLGLDTLERNSLHSKDLFDIKGLSTLEFGAGTALPSTMASLLGAQRVAVTDYPTEVVMETLRKNIKRNTAEGSNVVVSGHEWGKLDDGFGVANGQTFDRLFVCDCLWMPWQHENLRVSIAHFLKVGGQAWVISGFHSGRKKMKLFFDEERLHAVGLVVDRIWERDCAGVERQWDPERDDDVTERKRWLAVAVLKRV